METTLNTLDRTVLTIPGMHCGGCAKTIEKALHGVPGVEVAKADPGRKIAEVAGSASAADRIAAVGAAGYEAEVSTTASAAVEQRPAKSKCCCG